ncbi:MAG: hypothetical protein WD847_20960 [Pirellulales bacterium]
MIKRLPPESPAFVDSARLLVQLHKLLRTGQGDSVQADSVRDQMDGPWRELDEENASRIRGLSADLYSIGEQREASHLTEEQASVLHSQLESGDWHEALKFLREHELCIPPADLASFRGRCWARLKHHEVALLFFEEARRLKPGDEELNALYLQTLIAANHTGAAR